jgi:hypothetical protein
MGPIWVLLLAVFPIKYRVPLDLCRKASFAVSVLLLLGGLTAGVYTV